MIVIKIDTLMVSFAVKEIPVTKNIKLFFENEHFEIFS